ncbi:unnamed protein product [Citrullus colocynthis]|uniref:Uncharacterized protein n=1 Tax=Citrullus colocynthis TaxID=252529 RepID=A0ABP0Z5R7_9ROSI
MERLRRRSIRFWGSENVNPCQSGGDLGCLEQEAAAGLASVDAVCSGARTGRRLQRTSLGVLRE